MPALKNHRHEHFAQGLAKGMPATAAYEAAGYRPHGSNPARMSADERIKARVAEIIERSAIRVDITLGWVLERLVENAERAMQRVPVIVDGIATGEWRYDGNVANRALELIGKHLGVPDRTETTVNLAVGDNPKVKARALLELMTKRIGKTADDAPAATKH